MTAFAETARLCWHRYLGSRGIWLLLLVAPVAARFWVPRDDGTAMAVAVDGALPVMTSAVVGLSLGVVVATSFLPVAWAYLRRNVTNVRPWQTEDVAAARPVQHVLGRFAADVGVFALMLTVLSVAGCLLVWRTAIAGSYGSVVAAVWLLGFPPLVTLAGLRALLDARNLTRGAVGDVVFAVLWLASLITPLAASTATKPTGVLVDFAGFVRPLSSGDPAAHHQLAVGVFPVGSGRVAVDVIAGLRSDGYLWSRAAWCAVGLALAAIAGALYRSPLPRRHRATLREGAVPVPLDPGPAPWAKSRRIGLLCDTMLGLLGGRRGGLFLAGIASAGLVLDYRHLVGPAGLLWLVFAASRAAGRWQAVSLRMLTRPAVTGQAERWLAFIAVGMLLSGALALPACLTRGSLTPLLLGAATGVATMSIAAVLAVATRSSVIPRIVLIVAWYGYFAS